MARLLILGAGVAGHTSATFAKKWLGNKHEVVVVTPNSKWNWIPSNIWVGVGKMPKKDVVFELAPIYKRANIDYRQAKATQLHPEGKEGSDRPFVVVEYTGQNRVGEVEEIEYDYLINATGPKLNFAATKGLGPKPEGAGYTVSVCTADHAEHANEELQKLIVELKKGEHKRVLIGTGHGMATCQGAAFEYIFNVEHELRSAGVRDNVSITWISNEKIMGDLGMGGMHVPRGGYLTHSKVFTESIFAERELHWITGAHVYKVEEGKVYYETLEGEFKEEKFDFSMLIPSFAGALAGVKAIAKDGSDITNKVFAPNGMMKVDADYTPKDYHDWKASDWPETYQSPVYDNIFAAGIAFAPPHPISKPAKSPNGTMIFPTPPRTGMPAGIIGKAVAHSICDMIKGKSDTPTHKASMANMGAACIASTGKGLIGGTAVAITVYPVVPDFEKYPETGRDINYTGGEVGTAGHWIKHILHHMFIWKAKLKPGWTLIPE